MNSATIQLILALLPLAEELVFNIGGNLVKIATTSLTTPEAVAQALSDAKAEGFPQLSFVAPVVAAPAAIETAAPAAPEAEGTAGTESEAAGAEADPAQQ